MGGGDIAGDGEAKPSPAGVAGAGGIDAVEALEEVRQGLRWHPGGAVLEVDDQPTPLPPPWLRNAGR
jgi:hypothetical protein